MFNYGAIYEAHIKAETGAPVYFYLTTYWDKEHTYKQLPVRGISLVSLYLLAFVRIFGCLLSIILIAGCEQALDQAYWFGISFYFIRCFGNLFHAKFTV